MIALKINNLYTIGVICESDVSTHFRSNQTRQASSGAKLKHPKFTVTD